MTSLATHHELADIARLAPEDAVRACESSAAGLDSAEAANRLERFGPNTVAAERPSGWPRRLLRALLNPLVILLAILAVVAATGGDTRSAGVMTMMIVVGVTLRFVQETRGENAAESLRAMIHVTATAMRDGEKCEVPLHDIVPGDIVQLSAGDMVPADVRILSAKDLFVSQSGLTGESMPVEKFPAMHTDDRRSPLDFSNICFLGSSVQSGSATAVVVDTGSRTVFGAMTRSVAEEAPPTAFDRGVSRFTWMMIGFIAVLVPLVLLINGLTKHDWREAFFFALAVAVGLTPEMLPMIVSVCLSRGAVAMSKRHVIVKRLDSIQNIGAMDVLCTDKTGTLTMDHVVLERYCDPEGEQSNRVLADALIVSHLQTGLRSALDRATLEHVVDETTLRLDEHRKVDEIPFDFSRRIMSVVVDEPGGSRRMITKGAPDEVLARCTSFEDGDSVLPVEPAFLDDVRERCDALSEEGFRVLAVGYRNVERRDAYSRSDERDLTLRGFVGFLDPPKDSVKPALAALRNAGIDIKILTGDDQLVTRTVCNQVEHPVDIVMNGNEVAGLSDDELAERSSRVTIFARLSPVDKERIIRALQGRGHVVGFLGDGINDAPALHRADVGISVDSAVDVARATADVILLEKSLLILADGVTEGRKVFANVMKYLRMGASSNFGNMLSVVGASALLPFIPMAPIQILTNNLLYDISQVPIPSDDVDPEQVRSPRPWNIGELARYILTIGPISSIFDYVMYGVLYFVLGANTVASAALFHTGWFVESLISQTLIIHVIRTNRIPFLQSRASAALMATTAIVIAIGIWLPHSVFGPALGFVPLPLGYWPFLIVVVLGYLGLTQLAKAWLLRRQRIS